MKSRASKNCQVSPVSFLNVRSNQRLSLIVSIGRCTARATTQKTQVLSRTISNSISKRFRSSQRKKCRSWRLIRKPQRSSVIKFSACQRTWRVLKIWKLMVKKKPCKKRSWISNRQTTWWNYRIYRCPTTPKWKLNRWCRRSAFYLSPQSSQCV